MIATPKVARHKLTTLKPRVQTLRVGIDPHRAGDDRIRGSALQKIRDRILTRDRGVCQCIECKALKRLRTAAIVDHAIPLWAGGEDADHNRAAISEECHERKSALEAAMRAAGAYTPGIA